jgi:hypothetical protein
VTYIFIAAALVLLGVWLLGEGARAAHHRRS